MAISRRTSNDIKKFKKDMDKFFKSVTSGKEMRVIGNKTIKIVVERTRNHMKGVKKPLGRITRLKKVTKQYSEQRKKIRNKLKTAATGTNCNLTLRGTMLNNLSVLRATKKELVIGHRGRKNQIKAAHHHATGRPFLFLAKKEMQELMKFYDKRIGKQAKKV